MQKIKLNKLIYLIPILFLVLTAFVAPPGDITKKIQANLQTWRSQYAPEKVYVQLDKPYYAPGQDIWLKGYVLDAGSLRPSGKSGILYVDLLNAQNQPVERLTLKAENGHATGDIALPTDLPAGNYRLVAYTQWMRNFGEENFFSRELTVLGSNTPANTATLNTNNIDLQFFPEGGDLVAGLDSRVAFKAIGSNGASTAIKGAVYDDQNRKVVDFAVQHLGMGSFLLQPAAGKKYVARINNQAGQTLEFSLPAVKTTGYVLAIEENADADNILITVTGNTGKPDALVLTGISRQNLPFAQQIKVPAGEPYRVTVAKKDFPTGIVQFNLARTNGEPLAERLVFVDRQDDLQLTLATNKKTYAGRDQVTLRLTAKDNQGKPVSTDFALAITDDELVKPAQNSLNLKTHLLLTSDLKGQVEQPGYYFAENTLARKQALTNLLLTQGWRRFGWQEITTGNFPAIKYNNELDLAIRGQLVTNKGKAIAEGEALLYLQGQHLTFITTETDQEGRFAFEGFDYTGTIDVVVQGTDARGRRENLKVKMADNTFVPALPSFTTPWTSGLMASTSPDFLKASYRQLATAAQTDQAYTLRGVLLKTVEIKGEKDMVQPFKLHQQADAIISGNALPVAPSGNIIESLQGRVAGLQVYRSGPNQFRASIRGQQESPLYLLDGMPVSEGTVGSINQFDISRVEILKNAASASIYGGQASGGVIALFTKRGNEEPVEVRPGTYIITHQAKGYSKVREFYSPRYIAPTPSATEPDLRTTLYWNPAVKTNEQGVAEVTFYTADRNTTYRAIAEGISADGKPGSGTLTFGVNGPKRNL